MSAVSSWRNEEEDGLFRKFFIASVALHLSLMVGGGIKSLFFPSQIIEIPQSIRVDIVALPDKGPQIMPPPLEKAAPLKPATKEVPPVKIPAKETAKVNLSDKASQKKALEKLKALSAIEKMQKELAQQQENTKAASPTSAAAPAAVKGNIISSGSNFQGLSRLRVNDYLSALKSRVAENWVLPQWLSDANLKASVLVQIDSRGIVVRNEIYSSSGNSVFDSSCMAAVENSAPFPPAPREVSDNVILIRFPFD